MHSYLIFYARCLSFSLSIFNANVQYFIVMLFQRLSVHHIFDLPFYVSLLLHKCDHHTQQQQSFEEQKEKMTGKNGDLPANKPGSYTWNLKEIWLCVRVRARSNTNTSYRLTAPTEAYMHVSNECVKENDRVAYTATSKT